MQRQKNLLLRQVRFLVRPVDATVDYLMRVNIVRSMAKPVLIKAQTNHKIHADKDVDFAGHVEA